MTKTGRIVSDGAHRSSNALFGAAAIHVIPGLLYWTLYGFNSDLDDWIYSGGFILYIAMAVWARWSPVFPSIVCALFCTALVSLQLRNIANWNSINWIIQISLLILIGIAVYSGFTQHRED